MNYPSFRDFPFQLLIPNHFSAAGFVWFSISTRKIKLHKPIVIEQFCHGFEIKANRSFIIYLLFNAF